jgi:geranylgeranyl pyrophosphate synthase
MVEPKSGDVHGQLLATIDAAGERHVSPDAIFEPTRFWRSARTFIDYPVAWHLTSKADAIDLKIEAVVDDQELMTVMSKPSFWEGRCTVFGTIGGRPVSGLGYIERSGFEPLKNLDGFFGAVGEEVRKSVERHLPTHPTWEQTRDLIASEDRPQYMDGVNPDELARVFADPVRLITDRGGKSWRSYAALACCDVVGGDSRKWIQWLAMPEFMHVGSLIVDDVQDKSVVRRGGPACHIVYGDALAINAGTACYFMGQKLLFSNEVSDLVKLRLYDLYFEALRAGHAGQAIDLDPKTRLVALAVESGDSSELVARIIATHRLKTAAPAAALARMGALVGGGSETEVEAVGQFFEALGLAFQIVDDVLNLRGFKGNLKTRGEDVRNGTITLPVAMALGRLSLEDRRWLHATLESKPTDDAVVTRAVEMMESCGAITDAADSATNMVETQWRAADPILRDSYAKVMLRAFGWYVIERHY